MRERELIQTAPEKACVRNYTNIRLKIMSSRVRVDICDL